MRIDNNVRTSAATARTTSSRAGTSSSSFQINDAGAPAGRAAGVAAAVPSSGIEALLALQAVPDEKHERRRLVRRGRSLLDALDALKADLLAGRASEGHLNQLLALIGQAREKTEPGLDDLLDDIELRARVELAKRGLYPRL